MGLLQNLFSMLHEMGLVQLYATQKGETDATTSSRCYENSAFCRCQQDEDHRLQDKQISKYRKIDKCRRRMSCHCGEETNRKIEWTWDSQNVQSQTIINDNTVQFHTFYSQGSNSIIFVDSQ